MTQVNARRCERSINSLMSEMQSITGPVGVPHSLFEDAYAVVTGCMLVVVGLTLLEAAALVTGGVVGLALMASHFTPVPAGVLLPLVNAPFFLLAGRALGSRYLAKAVAANFLISALAFVAPLAFRLVDVNAWVAALVGGTVIGVGILVLARHHVGVGGIGMIALALHRRKGWNAGRTQLAADSLILLAALPILALGPTDLAVSVASAVAVAAVLIVFHKPGRYAGY